MSRVVKIKLPDGVFRGIPTEGMPEGIGERMVNCYKDASGIIRKRPGLDLFLDFSIFSGIQGIYWWEEKEWLIVVCHGRLFKVTASNGVYEEVTGGDKLNNSGQVSFANNKQYLAMANGGRIVLYDGTEDPFYVKSLNAPTAVTHVVMFDGMLVALQANSSIFWFSTVDDVTEWDPLDFASANFSSDNATALFKAENELALFGTQTVEFFYNDGVSPFRRLEYTTESVGCPAPKSIVYVPGVEVQGTGGSGNANGQWLFLDSLHRVVQLKNRTLDVISAPFDDIIGGDGFSVSDARGDYIVIGRQRFYVLSFPTQGVTLALNMAQTPGRWAEWGTWSPASASFGAFIAGQYVFAEKWGFRLLCDMSHGKIYKMKSGSYSDNGVAIRAYVLTAPGEHGSLLRKRCEQMRIKLRRGAGDATDNEPIIRWRWRDDNQDWGNWRPLSMGKMGSVEHIIRINQLGSYRTRQYEFSATENTDFLLAEIEADIQNLHI